MVQALYRKYRSKTLEEIVGQDHITSVLKKSLDKGLISHAYLFTGPRGVGKTSVARILAKNINNLKPQENSLDIIEIDAASNNSVEDIRNLREKVQVAPVNSLKKVYIIDEVHMLSRSAFNALLKTLEEPPAHVVFILATTNPDKLPDTIISRTQHFAFRNFTIDTISKQLKFIATKEKLQINSEALKIISLQANGGMRDALSLLDQLSSLGEEEKGKKTITAEMVINILGLPPIEAIKNLIKATIEGDFLEIKSILKELSSKGVSGAVILDQILSEILIQSHENPDLIQLLSSLSKLNKKEDYLDIRLLTTLGLFKSSDHSALKTISPLKKQVKAKTVSLQTSPTPVITELPVMPSVTKKPSQNLKDFNWEAIVENSRKKHLALASLVVKCKHDLIHNEGKLILYTMNKFNKKKLDDPKYLPHFYAVLTELGFSNLQVETIPSGPPPKGETENKIANIMGGGEVVEVDI